MRRSDVVVEVIAEPLGHPEGPDLLRSGALIFVEADAGRLCRWSPGHAAATYAITGGAPYGCTLGADDHIYVTQSGLGDPVIADHRPVPPSIQRVTPDGAMVTELVTAADGGDFIAPNDLCWGRDGALYFTDSGRWQPDNPTDVSRIVALRPDGTAETVLELGPVFANGIACESDGSIVWLESYTGVIGRLRPDGSHEAITMLPEGHTPEGLAVAADGSLWVTTFEGGTVDVLAPDGRPLDSVAVGGVPVNCCFAEGWLYIADFGLPSVPDDLDSDRSGRMLRIPTTTVGLELFRGSINIKGKQRD